MVKKLVLFLMVVAVSLGLTFVVGCESDAQTGALIGSLAGAGIGQAAGGDTESTLLGAAIGGGAGYLIGSGQDSKKKTQAEIDSLRRDINTVTVNITNSNGSISQVLLRKQGVGYVGPRNEYYDHLPTQEELKPIYGF